MSVTPGSWTLWSVHSGQRCWTNRFASSTRSWNRRSSRFGALSMLPTSVLTGRDHVEREHQVSRVVQATDGIRQVDVEDPRIDTIEGHPHVLDVDTRFPALQGF